MLNRIITISLRVITHRPLRVGFAFLLVGGATAHAQEVLWQRDGDSTTSRFGSGVYPLGDQNDDGFADWAVFIDDEDRASTWLSGLDFFYGGNLPTQEPYMRLRGRPGNPAEIIYQTNFGDFNGDGSIDWMVGYYPLQSDSIFYTFYEGGTLADTIPEQVLAIGEFNTIPSSSFVYVIGDHNGDGMDDFYYYDSRPSDLVYIYLGDEDWNFEVALVNQGEPIFSGSSIPRPRVYGDLNGDGFDDYPTGEAGALKIYYGGSTPDTTPDLIWPDFDFTLLTLSVDMNNDGYNEIIYPVADDDLNLHYGGVSPSTVPTGTLDFPNCSEGGISRATSAGDFNGDGYEDLVSVSDICVSGFGRFAVFAGGPYVRRTPILVQSGLPHSLLEGIWWAVGVGDINNDGIDDLAVGCQNGFNRRGRVVIFSGDTTLILPAEERLPVADNFSLLVYPNPANSTLSISLDVPLHQEVTMSLYDLLGREVDVVYGGRLSSSTISYVVPAALSSGVYFLRASANSTIRLNKVALIK